MDEFASFSSKKRKPCPSTFLDKCLICQKSGGDNLRKPTGVGRQTFKDAVNARSKLNCEKFKETINRLRQDEIDLDSDVVCWHKNCFSLFTSSSLLARLRKKAITPPSQKEEIHEKRSISPALLSLKNVAVAMDCSPMLPEPQIKKSSRRYVSSVDWDKCIYCQASCKGSVLHQVLTLETSNRIINASKTDNILRTRLAAASDLVAVEAKYHLKCYSAFCRYLTRSPSVQISQKFEDVCLQTVFTELENGIDNGNIYSVKSVWDRYAQLTPNSHKCSTTSPEADSNTLRDFRQALKSFFGDKIELLLDRKISSSCLIVPVVSQQTVVQTIKLSADENEILCVKDELKRTFSAESEDTRLLKSMYHVAAEIKSDIRKLKEHHSNCSYNNVNAKTAEETVPRSLFLFLSMLLGETDDQGHRNKVLSIGQDIVFLCGKILTPKHIGLGVTIHHATRSKYLIQLLNAAGHCASYECLRRIDASIATSELKEYQKNANVFIPRNLVPGRFVQFAADNIDIIEETPDGKGQFNATQYAAFQYGANDSPADVVNTVIGNDKSFSSPVLSSFRELSVCNYDANNRPEPNLKLDLVNTDIFEPDRQVIQKAMTEDFVWMQCRQDNSHSQVIPAWTGFNQVVSLRESEVSEVGYAPIIPSPADEMDTIFTVLLRCKLISERLGQKYTIVTFDQALYCKAKELVWLKTDELNDVIVRLGTFHITMNFLKVLGQHMHGSGLRDIWIESGLFGENTVEHVLNGKAYNKAVRAHKLTLEALTRLYCRRIREDNTSNILKKHTELRDLCEGLASSFENRDTDMAREYFQKAVAGGTDAFDEFQNFHESDTHTPTRSFWKMYMDLVELILCIIKAEREGNWELHLSTFAKMLPWFFLYGHTNYSRWGPIYLAEMRKLNESAPLVHNEFTNGKFSVKKTANQFCQVATDQALEHINKVSKISGGIIGIARQDDTRDKWCLTYNIKSKIADATLAMFNLNVEKDVDEEWCHNELGPTRIKRDEDDVSKLVAEFSRFGVFSEDSQHSNKLISLCTRDVVPDTIAESIMSSETKGCKLLREFVCQRLATPETGVHGQVVCDRSPDKISFFSKLSRPNIPNMANMLEASNVTPNKAKQKVLKYDRDVMRRLLIAAEGGRTFDNNSILKHELSPIPLSLANIDGTLHRTNKSDLVGILTTNAEVKADLPSCDLETCIAIDGPALIQAIGKPTEAKTFGDLADIFTRAIFCRFSTTAKRVDVLFDRYFDLSVKAATRTHRTGTMKPIRKIIDTSDVMLPKSWKQFISSSENKTDLASFLSEQLVQKSDQLGSQYELVLAGGFRDGQRAWSSSRGDISHLISSHEEADTRIILHSAEACDCGYQSSIIVCRDTDVLILAIYFRSKLSRELWISAGTSRKPQFIPIHLIELQDNVISNLVAFHALTGCDTTSQFLGKGKKSTWSTFIQNPDLLEDLGGDLKSTDPIEKFVCLLYSERDANSIDEVRAYKFMKGKASLESLPPTRDALLKHISRAHYQTSVWKNALTPLPKLPQIDRSGWNVVDGELHPEFMTLEPIPKACRELVSCNCRSGCKGKCGCLRQNLRCVMSCWCCGECDNRTDAIKSV